MTSQTEKVRVNKMFLATLPKPVAEKLDEVRKQYNAGNIRYNIETGYTLRPMEGYKYYVWYNGEWQSVQMFRGDSLGASGVCYDLSSSVKVPAGAWLITLSDWICGKRGITLVLVISEGETITKIGPVQARLIARSRQRSSEEVAQ